MPAPMPQTSGAPCGKTSPRHRAMAISTVKLAAWLRRMTRSAPPMVPPAFFAPMPPEKSPPPHKTAAARASRAFRCNRVSLLCSNDGRLDVLRRGIVPRLRNHRQVRSHHLDLNGAVLAVDKGLVGVVADGVLRPYFLGDLGEAVLNAILPELGLKVAARLLGIGLQNVVARRQGQVNAVEEA